MRVCFYTLGCKVNLNETGALEQMFRGAGFTIVPEGEEADVFVVNSCTVTNFGDQKSRKWLRRAKRESPGAVTVLTGCYPQAFPEEAAQFMEADLVCGNGDRKAILDNVLKLLDGHERIVAVTPHQRGELFEELPVERFETHTRAFIKVEDGCNRQCAYCVIPRARGPVRSRAEDSILKELRQLAGAPHVDDAGAPYPGTCRHLGPEERRLREAQGRRACLRLRCPAGCFHFRDGLLGEQSFTLEDCGGDFALRRSDGVVAYQLAVALDDALMGITQVVRGRDILTSTPRQLALLRLWGFEPPAYAHIPLLLDGQGERLAKRHQSLGVRELRRQGVAAAEIVGVLARLAGLRPDMRPVAASDLLEDFRLERLPRHDVCLRDLPRVPEWLRPLCLPC